MRFGTALGCLKRAERIGHCPHWTPFVTFKAWKSRSRATLRPRDGWILSAWIFGGIFDGSNLLFCLWEILDFLGKGCKAITHSGTSSRSTSELLERSKATLSLPMEQCRPLLWTETSRSLKPDLLRSLHLDALWNQHVYFGRISIEGAPPRGGGSCSQNSQWLYIQSDVYSSLWETDDANMSTLFVLLAVSGGNCYCFRPGKDNQG